MKLPISLENVKIQFEIVRDNSYRQFRRINLKAPNLTESVFFSAFLLGVFFFLIFLMHHNVNTNLFSYDSVLDCHEVRFSLCSEKFNALYSFIRIRNRCTHSTGKFCDIFLQTS